MKQKTTYSSKGNDHADTEDQILNRRAVVGYD